MKSGFIGVPGLLPARPEFTLTLPNLGLVENLNWYCDYQLRWPGPGCQFAHASTRTHTQCQALVEVLSTIMAAYRTWQRILTSIMRKQSSVRAFSNNHLISSKGFRVFLAGAVGIGSIASYKAFCSGGNRISLPTVQAAKDGVRPYLNSFFKEKSGRRLLYNFIKLKICIWSNIYKHQCIMSLV